MRTFLVILGTLGIIAYGSSQLVRGATTLDCSAAGMDDVYDTPSGKIEAGYYDPVRDLGTVTDATSGKASIIATVIDNRVFEICTDTDKKQYEYSITPTQFTDFKISSQTLPVKAI